MFETATITCQGIHRRHRQTVNPFFSEWNLITLNRRHHFSQLKALFEHLFIDRTTDASPLSPIRRRKGVIIGAGQVGMACAYSLLIQDCFDELVLQDINRDRAEGEVMDLVHGLPFVSPTQVTAGSVADAGYDADLVVITAGASQRPGESRLDLVERNVAIFRTLIADIVTYCPHAILLIVANPVDIMTYVSWKLSGFPAARVIGSGTVLDSARFRALLAQKLGIDPRSVHAYIIGEHGDSEVPVWSKVHVAGVPLCEGGWTGSPSADDPALAELFHQVKTAADEIIQRKGYTSYAIGLAVTDIVKAILRSQERVLTVSSAINGLYGIEGVCLSLPSVVNEFGVAKLVDLSLSATELAQLQRSAQILHEIIDRLDLPH